MDDHNELVPQRASPPGLLKRYKRGPENEKRIAQNIAQLLAHYWAANESPTLRKALANDWIEDLAEFSHQLVGEACTHWRQNESRRPTIADIRRYCVEYAEPMHSTPPHLKIQATKLPTEEEEREQLERRRVMGDKLGELTKMLRGEIPWPEKSV